jgi:HSP20 family protein
MSLMRWDPFRELESFRERMNRMFEESLAPVRGEPGEQYRLFVPLDVYEEGGSYIVSAELPGVKPEDVDITVTGNTLSIKGESHTERDEERANVHYRERRYGTFSRTVELPSDIDTSKIEASFEHGVLKITAARAAGLQPRKIAVKGVKPREIAASAGKGAAHR